MKKKLSLLMLALLSMAGIVLAAAFEPTNATEEIVLTKTNIEANDYLSVTTDNWATGKTYGDYSGDFYNMSKAERQLLVKVKGVSKFEVLVQNSNAGRGYTVKVGSGSAQAISHQGSGIESSGEIETGTANEVTITLAGDGSGSVYPVAIKLTKAEGSTGGDEPAEDVTAIWSWKDGIPSTIANVHIENGTGTVASNVEGIELFVDATKGKLASNGDNAQFNKETIIQVPVKSAGDIVTVASHSYNFTEIKVGGSISTSLTTTYTAKATDAQNKYVEVEATADMYLYSISVTQKATTDEPEQPVVNPEECNLEWDYTEKDIPTVGPDNGLYYGGYVNDAAGTNNSMHGVKLNNGGYCYFAKQPVAGVLTLTFGNRKNSDAYAVNVYEATIDEDGKGTKGALIGDVSVTESPGTGSIDIPASVTGIWIERKTGAEGVMQKIVFKVPVPRTFVDFEIPYEKLSTTFDPSTLPEGVTFSGNQRNDQHGYDHVTIVVPVDGTVKFTIGGCQYANPANCTVTNSEGEVLATPNLKTSKCYHLDGSAATYIYTGEPTTLTFSNIAYLPYFKAEATEVSEVTITYKDQNGNKLGTKTVFEGEAIGEVPYTEADLTIDEGEAFRGWVYNSGVKVQPTDIITGNTTIKASVTPIESVGENTIQTYDFTKVTFYPEDHETCEATGGKYHDSQHGWDFGAGGTFSFDVAGNAQIVLTICEYGSGTTITLTDANGNVIEDGITAKADSGSDGATVTLNYEGPATRLTLTFATQTYLHKVEVYNVSDFMEKDEASGYYIVAPGDAAGLVMAINSASSEEGAKIFLPDGTYDLGNTVLTGVSGKNVSIIGQSAENTIIMTVPEKEGLGVADLLVNTGEGLYMQDITLKNAFPYNNNDGRAPSLHDKGNKTICKNVNLLSHQDTYYSHKVGGLFYFEGGELHGTVDYLCGNGRVYFNEVKLVNEQRNSATISANSELYVFNNCTVENNADAYNFGRAWSDNPVCIYLNTTLLDPDKLIGTRWNLNGINCDYSIAGEYGTKNENGADITPAENTITFTKQNTQMNTILDETALDTYSIDNVLGEWASEAQEQAQQVEAPDAAINEGTITWTAVDGATAYAIFCDGEFLGITTDTSFEVDGTAAGARPMKADEAPVYTIRAANLRGGFGEPKTITIATAISELNNQTATPHHTRYYNAQGVEVNSQYKGVVIKMQTLSSGKNIATKVLK
ncbi:MAG: hypothetical protein J5506_10500 [Prevotella sp.]|nr:hypothetical protein [Prevotella sp.]